MADMLPLGFIRKDVERIARAVRTSEGEAEPLRRPRGRYPIAGGGGLRVAYIVQDIDGETGGDPTYFATDYTGLLTIKCNSKPDGTGRAFDEVYIRSVPGVWFTGGRVLLARIKDKYFTKSGWELVSPGELDWKGTADGDISDEDAGDIALPFYDYRLPGATTITIPNAVVELLDPLFPVADASDVRVRFNLNSGKFEIYWAGCRGPI